MQSNLRPFVLIIGLMVVLLSACQGKTLTSQDLPGQTVQPVQTSSTPEPSSTVTTVHDSLNTAAARIGLTHTARAMTPSPTPTPSPTITSIPLADLSSTGPWLISFPDHQRGPLHNIFLISTIGSGYSIPNLPQVQRLWTAKPAPQGGLIAFRTVSKDGNPYFIQRDGVDDMLFILKLPENEVIAKIPLLGNAAWETVQSNLKQPESKSTVLGLLSDEASFQWAPDGRSLIYSAAIETESLNLYRYTIDTEKIDPLTINQQNAIFWSWSPGGDQFLYRTVEKYEDVIGLLGSTFLGTYLYDTNGQIKHLYIPTGDEAVKWVDNDRLFIYNINFEYSWNLRLVNLQNKSIDVVYPEYFAGYEYLPIDNRLFLNLSTNVYLDFGDESGIYQVTLNNMQRIRAYACENCFFDWDDQQNEFYLWIYQDSGTIHKMFSKSWKEIENPPNAAFAFRSYSADLQWFIASNTLYGSDMNEVLPFVGGYLWDKKEPAFYTFRSACGATCFSTISYYAIDNQWKPVDIAAPPTYILDLELISP